MKERLNVLENFWDKHDTRSMFFDKALEPNKFGKFVDAKCPTILTARLSGMYLDYPKLIKKGIKGIEEEIRFQKSQTQDEEKIDLYDCFLECMQLLRDSIKHYINECNIEKEKAKTEKRKEEMQTVIDALEHILVDKPETMIEGIELAWIYMMLSMVVNYGRMDVYWENF